MYSFSIWDCLPLHRQKIKLASFLSALLFLASPLMAQENLPNHDKKKVHFGISLGFNQSKFAITHSEAFTFHDTIKVVDSPRSAGFNVGIVSDLHLSKHADLRFIPTLVFSEKDLRYTEANAAGDTEQIKTVESIILKFPLTFKYKSDRFFNNFRFYALGGARIDWDLASNSKARKATDIVKIDTYDAALEYGFGLEFYFPMFIFAPEIKFSQGLLNLHVPTEGLRFSDVLGRLRSQAITVSFQFEG